MAFKAMGRDAVATWLRETHGDELVAMVRVQTPVTTRVGGPTYTNTSSATAVSPLWTIVEQIGRSHDDVVPILMGTGGLFVLSRDTFRVVGLGGLRPRPKHTRYEAPLDGLVFHHCDAEGGTGMRFRCWIVDLPDGRWIADSTALERKGEATPFAEDADGFLTALGDQARSLAR